MFGWCGFEELDLISSTTEFAYNSLVHRSIDMSSFEVVHGYKPRKPIDLSPMTHHPMVAEAASASHVHDLHKETSKKIQYNNANYKPHADLDRMHLEFNE